MQHWQIIKITILAAIFSAVFIATYFGLDISVQGGGISLPYFEVIQYSASAVFAVVVAVSVNLIGRQAYSELKMLIDRLSLADLSIGVLSIFIGLAIGALASAPLSGIPDPWSWISSIAIAIIAMIIAVWVFNLKKRVLIEWFQSVQVNYRLKVGEHLSRGEGVTNLEGNFDNPMVLDSSAIIDGRIKEVVRSGFLSGTLLLPEFIIQEVQYVADSSNSEKRQRGRAGLKLMQSIRRSRKLPVQTIKADYSGIKEVDAKLVRLAQELNAKIITCDYNLNSVARLSGVDILNVNELANSLKQVHLPGEMIDIKVVQPGREDGQGVGFLTDGTMVVIQKGGGHIGREVRVEVEKVLQTDAGKMIFAKCASKGKPVNSN